MCDEDCANCTKYRCELKELVFHSKTTPSRDRVNEQHRELRKRHLAKGMCADCGKRPVVPGITLCEECRMKRVMRDRRRKEREKAKS